MHRDLDVHATSVSAWSVANAFSAKGAFSKCTPFCSSERATPLSTPLASVSAATTECQRTRELRRLDDTPVYGGKRAYR